MRTKIYTKGGDSGETSLLGGPRVSKSNPQLEAYGTVDELNASIGICRSEFTGQGAVKITETLKGMANTLEITQNELFNVGSHLACADEKLRDSLPTLTTTFGLLLETQIDEMTAKLPELREFILPGGHPLSAALHMARTICRRAERQIVNYFESSPKNDSPERKQIIIELNRLGDYLFVAARYANYALHVDEIKWKKQ